MNAFVIIVKENVVFDIIKYDSASDMEDGFKAKCLELVPEWKDLSEDDKEIVMEDGYMTFDNGSVCMSWH